MCLINTSLNAILSFVIMIKIKLHIPLPGYVSYSMYGYVAQLGYIVHPKWLHSPKNGT